MKSNRIINQQNNKKKIIKMLITIIIVMFIIILLDCYKNKSYAITPNSIDGYEFNSAKLQDIEKTETYSNDWERGLILNKTKNTIDTKNSTKGYTEYDPTKYKYQYIGYSKTEYLYNFNLSDNKVITVWYRGIGTYGDDKKSVDVKMTFKNFSEVNPDNTNNYTNVRTTDDGKNVILVVGDGFYQGFHFDGYFQLDVDYEFYIDGKKTSIENTCFTTNSLNWGECVSYNNKKNSEPYAYYIEDKSLVKTVKIGNKNYVYGYRPGWKNSKMSQIEPDYYDFQDKIGTETFQRASASFKLDDSSIKTYSFTYRLDIGIIKKYADVIKNNNKITQEEYDSLFRVGTRTMGGTIYSTLRST